MIKLRQLFPDLCAPFFLRNASHSGLELHFWMSRGLLLGAGILFGFWASPLVGQANVPAASTEALRPTLNQINEVVAGLNIIRWKAPGEVRTVAQRDADSIQHDVAVTLPPLLDQANAQPLSVAPSFAVYRNIDALYDVLLRLSETATLAGPQTDAAALQGILTGLEASRRSLGDAILQSAANQEGELVNLRAVVSQAQTAAKPSPSAVPTKTVVDDGPSSAAKGAASTTKRKKKTASTPAANAPQPQ